jgi:hypothetical protein
MANEFPEPKECIIILVSGLILGAIIYVTLLPYMILTLKNRHFRANLLRIFRLKEIEKDYTKTEDIS